MKIMMSCDHLSDGGFIPTQSMPMDSLSLRRSINWPAWCWDMPDVVELSVPLFEIIAHLGRLILVIPGMGQHAGRIACGHGPGERHASWCKP